MNQDELRVRSLNDLEILDKNKILGEGAFSKVIKVRSKLDGKLYAMKKINLKTLSSEDQKYLSQEISLHYNLNHKYIINFKDQFKEQHYWYFLLEYAQNSSLFFYIHVKQGLPERLALKFIYQTALAIQYLHQKKLIHRDIKPENILFDKDFNIKLCDFGWSCENHDKIRQSICGTYEYMSPEIIYLGKHDQKIDIWCLGILLYEMVHGFPPFTASNMKEMKQQFQNKNILIKKSLSKDIKDLIKFILKSQYKQRPNIEQVLAHPTIQKNFSKFQKPLTLDEQKLLAKNFMINSADGQGRTLPLIVEQLQNNSQQKNNQNIIQNQQSYNNQNFKQNDNIKITQKNQQYNKNIQKNNNSIFQNKLNDNQKYQIQQNSKVNIYQEQNNKQYYNSHDQNQSFNISNRSLQSLQFLDNSFSSQQYYFQQKSKEKKTQLNLKQNYYIKSQKINKLQKQIDQNQLDFKKKNLAFNYKDKQKVQSVAYYNDKQKVQSVAYYKDKQNSFNNQSYNLYHKKYYMKEEPQINIKKINLYSNTQSINTDLKKQYQGDDSFVSEQDSIIVNNFVPKKYNSNLNSNLLSPISHNQIQSEKNIMSSKISPNHTIKRYNLNNLGSISSSIRSIQTQKNYQTNNQDRSLFIQDKKNQNKQNSSTIKNQDNKYINNIKNSFQPSQNSRIYRQEYKPLQQNKNYQETFIQQRIQNYQFQNSNNNQNQKNLRNLYIPPQKIQQQDQQNNYTSIGRDQKISYQKDYTSGSITSMRSITSYSKSNTNGRTRRVTRIKL